MFGSVAPILDKDDDESPYGDAFKVKYEDNFFFDASISSSDILSPYRFSNVK